MAIVSIFLIIGIVGSVDLGKIALDSDSILKLIALFVAALIGCVLTKIGED